ncbi:MAG: TIGR04255 family protein [Acidobacteria bacterium]|nr:TIGR04255 family protein [Acidobacteriota bacterium]
MTESAKQHLPEYDNPPVNEVVCGILFKSLDQLLAPYLGLLWERFKGDYPTCQEVPPIIPIIESFEERRADQKPEFAEIPPRPRVWFVHSNGNGVIQVQRDRFLHNWRKLKQVDKYPRFEQVFGMFSSHLGTFRAFLEEHKLGTVEPLQYELTYINHVYQEEGWRTNAEVGRIFADFVWRAKEGRFLPPPEGINWRSTFVLPNRAGRVHMVVRNGESREDGRPLYVFELTARGFIGNNSLDNMSEWFALAHEWIVCGFTDLTDEKTQRDVWMRTR